MEEGEGGGGNEENRGRGTRVIRRRQGEKKR
jgi:hypothetical protein